MRCFSTRRRGQARIRRRAGFFINVLFIEIPAVPEFRSAERVLASCRTGLPARPRPLRCELVDYQAVATLAADPASVVRRFPARCRQRPEVGVRRFRRQQAKRSNDSAASRRCANIFAAQVARQADWRNWPRNVKTQLGVRGAVRGSIGIGSIFSPGCGGSPISNWRKRRRRPRRGMTIGIYRDLAVGADSAGAETWAHPNPRSSRACRSAAGHSQAGPGRTGSPFNPHALRLRLIPASSISSAPICVMPAAQNRSCHGAPASLWIGGCALKALTSPISWMT